MKKKFFSILFALVLVFTMSLVTAVPAGAATTYYVDTSGSDGNDGSSGNPWATIQHAVDTVSPGDTIVVNAGTYAPFEVDGKTNLTIQSGGGTVTVQGVQSVTTNYTDRDCVVFVTDSTNIVLDGLDIQGASLGTINTKNYGIIYEASSGEINNCTVSPNTSGDMNGTAIGIWDESEVTVYNCTINSFGRIGVLVYSGCAVSILDSTIVGQVYSGEGEVCYGIEVEADGSGASQATIRGNEIYNCDNTYDPEPTWESGGVYINGWLEYQAEADSTVIIEDNDIHDNYIGIIVIKSPSSYAHANNIYDNRCYGVESVAAYDATTAVFDALNNWWGHASGPYHPTTNAGGQGDEVSDNVDYDPWQTAEVGGAAVSMSANTPEIVAIRVTPTSIDFGTLYPGDTSAETGITVENIGTVAVDVATSILDSAGNPATTGDFFYDNLFLDTTGPTKARLYEIDGLGVGSSKDDPPHAYVVVPSDYEAVGTVTGTLVFEATAD